MQSKSREGASVSAADIVSGFKANPVLVSPETSRHNDAITEKAEFEKKGKEKKRKLKEEKGETYLDNEDEKMAEGIRLFDEHFEMIDREGIFAEVGGTAMRQVASMYMTYQHSLSIAYVIHALTTSSKEKDEEIASLRGLLKLKEDALGVEKEAHSAAAKSVKDFQVQVYKLKNQVIDLTQIVEEKDELLKGREAEYLEKLQELAAESVKYYVKGRVRTLQDWKQNHATWDIDQELFAFHAYYPGEDLNEPQPIQIQLVGEDEMIADSEETDEETVVAETASGQKSMAASPKKSLAGKSLNEAVGVKIGKTAARASQVQPSVKPADKS